MGHPEITVAICTCNRSNSLSRCLASLTALEIPASLSWELLLVDNGSTDGTSEVIASFANRLPIRCVRELCPGLSNARNAAVAEARGRHMVWTDDDVLVDRNWLAAYAEAFERWPEAAVFGGRITPVLEEPSPPWFRENRRSLHTLLAERDFGDEPLPLSIAEYRLPFGANFALRTEEQRRHPYDPDLGVAPGRERLGEESAVLEAVLRDGHGYWLPAAQVQHMISPDRQTIGYVARYYRSYGETVAYRGQHDDRHAWFGVPRYLLRRLASRYLRYQLSRLTSPPAVWLENLKLYAEDHGAVRYFRSRRNEIVMQPRGGTTQ